MLVEPLLILGLLLVAGVAGGWVAHHLRLPHLTGYIAAGLFLGHHGLDVFGAHRPGEGGGVEALTTPVNDLAMALVLFVLGAQFRAGILRRSGRQVLTLSAVEGLLTFSRVTLVSWFAIGSAAGAVLLGVMAIAVAPATTIVVLREYRADGPATEALKLITALSNVWSVVFFEIAVLALLAVGGGETGMRAVAWDLFGSLFFGLVAGHVLILLQERTGRGMDSVPLLTVLCLTIGICKLTDVPHMLAFLVTGAVVVNRSRYFEPISAAMDVFARPAFVLFFVMSGLHLDFGVLADNWAAVGLYVLARVIGKVGGTRLGMHLARWSPPTLTGQGSPPLGLGLLCQAGAAIALASYVGARFDAELGDTLLNVILGGVVVFELAGPLLVKRVVVAAGEISVGELLVKDRGTRDGAGMLPAVRATLRGGRRARAADAATLTVGRIMRRIDHALPSRAGMDEILRFANRSPFNHFPVVADDGRLVGLIALADLDQVAYDKRTANLVVAADLATLGPEEASLPEDASLVEAVRFFRGFAGNTAAVIAAEGGMLAGMIERAEVMRLARSMQQG